MNRIVRTASSALGTLVLFGAVVAANAQTAYFPNDATINYGLPNLAIVGYANDADFQNKVNGTSPIVNLVSGGGGNSASALVVYNRSILNASGGGGNLTSFDSSTINLSAGIFAGLSSGDNSVFNFSGGSNNNASSASGASAFNISGTAYTHGFNARENSVVTISGGSLTYLGAYDSSIINVTGGAIGDALVANSNNVVNISGGTFFNALSANGSSVLNFFGTGLSANLYSSTNVFYNTYNIYGKLADGTDLRGQQIYVNGPNARFTLTNVPAPASMPIFAIGMAGVGVGIFRKRQKK